MSTFTFLSAPRRARAVLAFLCLAGLMGHSAKARFATTPPVQDGTINAGEYGANGGTWSMS